MSCVPFQRPPLAVAGDRRWPKPADLTRAPLPAPTNNIIYLCSESASVDFSRTICFGLAYPPGTLATASPDKDALKLSTVVIVRDPAARFLQADWEREHQEEPTRVNFYCSLHHSRGAADAPPLVFQERTAAMLFGVYFGEIFLEKTLLRKILHSPARFPLHQPRRCRISLTTDASVSPTVVILARKSTASPPLRSRRPGARALCL